MQILVERLDEPCNNSVGNLLDLSVRLLLVFD
jgi:hypothetical protein